MDKKLFMLVLAFFVVLGAFALVLVNRNTVLTKASNQTPSSDETFLIVTSNGDECSINAVVRDASQKVIAGKEVCASISYGTLSPQCAITDETGIAQFKALSQTAGSGIVSAEVSSFFPITTKVSCQFNP